MKMETTLQQPPIELKENDEPKTIQLDDEEKNIIESKYKKKLKIQYTRDGQTKLKASHYAGYFVLPKRVIEVSPKYARANFLGMIKYALELPEIGTDKLPINENDTFWEILVSIFLKKLEELFQRGLMSNYIEYEENLNLIRGKIDFKEHLLRNYNRKDRIYCRFDEFSQNILENQIIKTTLYKLIFNSQLNIFSSIQKQLDLYYRRLGNIDLISSNRSLSFDSIHYTQMNSHYKKILNICKLLLGEQSFETSLNNLRGISNFDINMDMLFEKFITNFLKESFELEEQATIHYDKANKRFLRPDIILLENSKQTFILDTKYYEDKTADDEDEDNEELPNTKRTIGRSNVAQMVLYSNSTGIKKLGLIYPGKYTEPDKIEIKNDIELNIFHIDLEGETREDFEDNCEKLKNQLLNCVIK